MTVTASPLSWRECNNDGRPHQAASVSACVLCFVVLQLYRRCGGGRAPFTGVFTLPTAGSGVRLVCWLLCVCLSYLTLQL